MALHEKKMEDTIETQINELNRRITRRQYYIDVISQLKLGGMVPKAAQEQFNEEQNGRRLELESVIDDIEQGKEEMKNLKKILQEASTNEDKNNIKTSIAYLKDRMAEFQRRETQLVQELKNDQILEYFVEHEEFKALNKSYKNDSIMLLNLLGENRRADEEKEEMVISDLEGRINRRQYYIDVISQLKSNGTLRPAAKDQLYNYLGEKKPGEYITKEEWDLKQLNDDIDQGNVTMEAFEKEKGEFDDQVVAIEAKINLLNDLNDDAELTFLVREKERYVNLSADIYASINRLRDRIVKLQTVKPRYEKMFILSYFEKNGEFKALNESYENDLIELRGKLTQYLNNIIGDIEKRNRVISDIENTGEAKLMIKRLRAEIVYFQKKQARLEQKLIELQEKLPKKRQKLLEAYFTELKVW
jgi:hypothetical protein